MEWTICLRRSIEYIEMHLLEDIDIAQIADAAYISPFYLQKGFKVMTGVTMTEYIRNRRLYLAALDILGGRIKIIDAAYKYGYDSPESFSKAFSRFHGITPSQLKGRVGKIKPYLPLKISISISGGSSMDYVVEKMKAFKVIGFSKKIGYEKSYMDVPKFWQEYCAKYCGENKLEGVDRLAKEVIEQCCIGEYGICVCDEKDKMEFDYWIAGKYTGGEIPQGMAVYEIPEMEWVKFRCVGPMPGALQAVNTKIFKEWLPGNEEYEIASSMNIEWYSAGDGSAQDYESGIWVPVKRK